MAITYPSGLYVGQLFFESYNDGHGWSEKYWIGAADLAAAETALNEIAEARVGLLADTSSITYQRVSDPAISGDSFVKSEPIEGEVETTEGTDDQCHANVAVVLRCQTATGKHSTRYLHGIVESWVDGDLFQPPPMGGQMAAYATAVKDNAKHVRLPPGGDGLATMEAIDEVVSIRVSTRRTGRPFGQSRGRSL